jgi:hypothetical protein
MTRVGPKYPPQQSQLFVAVSLLPAAKAHSFDDAAARRCIEVVAWVEVPPLAGLDASADQQSMPLYGSVQFTFYSLGARPEEAYTRNTACSEHQGADG